MPLVWNPIYNKLDMTGNPKDGITPEVILKWTRVSGTSQSMEVGNGYTPTNVSLTTFTLPITAKVGEIIKIDGEGTGLFSISQNANQIIHMGTISSTLGVTGHVDSFHKRDCISLRCIVENTDFEVENSIGNFDLL